ncbi:hypothetical protein BDD12DRAFT_851355 [Trichophaea hybrida]|nr:hypothetical protein BDD12DRAFT_851355 [Trichophaea hybrida]
MVLQLSGVGIRVSSSLSFPGPKHPFGTSSLPKKLQYAMQCRFWRRRRPARSRHHYWLFSDRHHHRCHYSQTYPDVEEHPIHTPLSSLPINPSLMTIPHLFIPLRFLPDPDSSR